MVGDTRGAFVEYDQTHGFCSFGGGGGGAHRQLTVTGISDNSGRNTTKEEQVTTPTRAAYVRRCGGCSREKYKYECRSYLDAVEVEYRTACVTTVARLSRRPKLLRLQSTPLGTRSKPSE